MDDGFVIEVLLVGCLIVLNGLFSGAEIAVVSARVGRLRTLAEEGRGGAQAALRLKADPDRFLATVQIGVTMVGTLASAVGGVAAIERVEPFFAAVPASWVGNIAEPLAVAVVVFTIAYLSLVVGELIPKSLAVRHAETIALAVARPVEWLSRVSAYPVALLTASSRLGLRLLGQRPQSQGNPFHTLEDLRALLEDVDRSGVDTGVLAGAFSFQDRDVREVMTPRPRIVALRPGATVAEARRVIAESRHTRFPVMDSDRDEVVGVLHARDLYTADEADRSAPITVYVRPAIFVPDSKKATELLPEMRGARSQMAIVIDEHGSMVGIVTIEDLVEVIVGEIPDEHRPPDEPATVVSRGVIEAEGSLPIRDLNDDLDLTLPESPDYLTVAGLVLDRLGSVPKGGESVEVPPYRITVTGVEGRRIARVRIETAAEAPAPAAAPSPAGRDGV